MSTHLFNEIILIDHPLLKNEVVVMEDNPYTLNAISSFMREKLNWKVIKCNNQDEVVEIAQQKRATFFILDCKIGNNNQEGLDALERIKQINQNFFVAIISAYPVNRRFAEKLKCNLFVDKNNITRNTFCIANKIIKFRKKFVDNILKEINQQQRLMENLESEIDKQLEVIERFEQLYKNSTAQNIPPNEKNPPKDMQAANRSAYEEYQSNSEWVSKHQGKYAAFVDGEFKFSCKDRDEFFNQLITSDKYKEKQIFFAEVSKKERIIEDSTSLWFELIED